MKVENILTELEKDKLKLVSSDEVMVGAIKKVIMSAVYFDGTLDKKGIPAPLKNFALALASRPGVKNEDLGADLKASLAGVQLLETGFKELEKFNVQEFTAEPVKNQAR